MMPLEAAHVGSCECRACTSTCEAIAPKPHTQAGARCEREPHASGNHRVAPKDGKPGAVWRDPVV